MRRILPVLSLLIAVAFAATACSGGGFSSTNTTVAPGGSSGSAGGGGGGDKAITIGSTNFSEQLLLANMYAQLLEKNGYKVTLRPNLGNREVVMPALTSGQLDLIPEYTGSLMLYFDKSQTVTKPEEVVAAINAKKPAGTELLTPSKAEDKDAFAVTKANADKYKLKKVSDMTPEVAKTFVVGGAPEMAERPQGLPGYKRVYGLEFKEFKPLDAGGPVTAAALDKGEIDVGRVFTTQGILKSKDWVILEDDKNLHPAQQVVPFARADKLDAAGRDALNKLNSILTTEDLIDLNAQIDVDKKDPDKVAAEWLKAKGLV